MIIVDNSLWLYKPIWVIGLPIQSFTQFWLLSCDIDHLELFEIVYTIAEKRSKFHYLKGTVNNINKNQKSMCYKCAPNSHAI